MFSHAGFAWFCAGSRSLHYKLPLSLEIAASQPPEVGLIARLFESYEPSSTVCSTCFSGLGVNASSFLFQFYARLDASSRPSIHPSIPCNHPSRGWTCMAGYAPGFYLDKFPGA